MSHHHHQQHGVMGEPSALEFDDSPMGMREPQQQFQQHTRHDQPHQQQQHQQTNRTSGEFVFQPATALLINHDQLNEHQQHQHAEEVQQQLPTVANAAAAVPSAALNAPAAAATALGQAMLASLLYAHLGAAAAGGVPQQQQQQQNGMDTSQQPQAQLANPAHALFQQWVANAAGAPAALPNPPPATAAVVAMAVPSTKQQANAAQAAAARSHPSELDVLRSYQSRANTVSAFEKHFRDLPFNLQLDALKNPPEGIGPAQLLNAVISLPLKTQAAIMKRLPLSMQKGLIKSLLPSEKKRILDVLSGKEVDTYYDEDEADKFCDVPPEMIERASRLQREGAAHSSSMYISAVGDVVTLSDQSALLAAAGASSSSIDSVARRRVEASILSVIQKMMLSFGDIHYVDAPVADQRAGMAASPMGGAAGEVQPILATPSIYSALLICDHVHDLLSHLLSLLPRKPRSALRTLVRLLPLQSRGYFRWKTMSAQSKQEATSRMKHERNELGMRQDAEEEDEEDEEDEESKRDKLKPKRRRPNAAYHKSTTKRSAASSTATSGSKRKRKSAKDDDVDDESDASTPRGKAGRGGKRKNAAAGGRGAKRTKRSTAMVDLASESDAGVDGSSSSSGSNFSQDDEDVGSSDGEEGDASDEDASGQEGSEAEEQDPDVDMAKSLESAGGGGAAGGVEDAAAKEEEEVGEKEVERIIAETVKNGAAGTPASSTVNGTADDSVASAHFSLYLPTLDLHLGPLHRLRHQDAISSPMTLQHYMQWVKAREASFAHPPRRAREFVQWIVGGGGARPLPPHTATLLKTGNGSHLLKLLAYLAWDRIGMIVEIASRLRECSRHARSALAFTVYEVEKAIGMLEAQEETSLKKMQERGRAIVSSGAGAEDIDIDSTEATTTIKDATISPRSWAAAANEQLKALAMPGAVAAAASSTESEEVAAAVAAAKAAKEAAVTMEQAGAAYGFPPLHSFPLAPAASSAAPYLPPPEPEAASTPVPKHARFSDGAKLRLQAMADACGWKYRQKNPQVQEIHAMDGLGFDQIRGWMANNKPVEFKRQKPAGPAGPKKKMVLPASPPSPPAMAAPIDDGGPPQLPAGETVGAMKRPTPSPAKKAKGAAAESAAE